VAQLSHEVRFPQGKQLASMTRTGSCSRNPASIWSRSHRRNSSIYTGQIPLEEVKAAFSKAQLSSKYGNKIVVLENVENESAA
jgi:hypothetical protein